MVSEFLNRPDQEEAPRLFANAFTHNPKKETRRTITTACKAALNASMKILAGDLASRGVTVVPIAPGHTRTDMGGSNAPYTAEDSVTRVRGAISRLTFNDSGAFLSRDGVPLPW